MRLINADSLKYRRKDYGGHDDVSDEERKHGILFLLKEDIDDAPTIDAIPVVRCANCKYLRCNMRQDGSVPFGFDEYDCDLWHWSCDPTDFCSYAERSEE